MADFELFAGEIELVADNCVFPRDHSVAILQRQAIEVQEYLEWVQPCELCHRIAFTAPGEARDHLCRVALQYRPRLAQGMRAEVRLQRLAVAGVLGRVERQGHYGQRIARWLQDPRREDLGISQRREHVLAPGQVVVAIHEDHGPGVPQCIPPDRAVGG